MRYRNGRAGQEPRADSAGKDHRQDADKSDRWKDDRDGDGTGVSSFSHFVSFSRFLRSVCVRECECSMVSDVSD